MAKYNFNVLGNFSNKLGNIVGYNRMGQQVARGYLSEIADPNTAKQQLYRQRFSLLASLAAAMKHAATIGLKPIVTSRKSTTYGEFVRLNNINLTGTLSDLVFDYESLLVAKGSLTGAEFGTASFSTPLTVIVPITDGGSAADDALSDDAIYLLAYCPDLNKSSFTKVGVARSATEISVTVPTSFQGLRVYLYGFVARADKSVVSDTAYIGYGNIS